MNIYGFMDCFKLILAGVLLVIVSLNSGCWNDSKNGNGSSQINASSNSNRDSAVAPAANANLSGVEANANKSGDAEATNNIPEILPGLEAEYYEDADGNGVPNFMETEMGRDPEKDDCPQSECGDPAEMLKYFQSPHNTLLMLDSSGSMRSKNRMTKAKEILANYVSKRLPQNFKNGFLVYGHRGNNTEAGKAESCAGVELLAPLGDFNGDTAKATLAKFEPTGWTPIASALEKAGTAFDGMDGEDNRIIMVSDGLETCGGDPLAAARALNQSGFKLRVDVVGFGVESADAARLREIAEAGGGEYFDAHSDQELREYFQKQHEAYDKTFKAVQCRLRNTTGQSMICDQTLVNNANSRILPQINKEMVSGNDKRLAALRSLFDRIVALRDERARKVDEENKDLQEVLDKFLKFGAQTGKDVEMIQNQ